MTTPVDPTKNKGTIGKACLTNNGNFNCKLYFKANSATAPTDHWLNSSESGTLLEGQTDCEDPGNMGVQDGMIVRVCANVQAGSDYFGNEQFTYQSGSLNRANYRITGTTLNADLSYQGMTTAQPPSGS
jgi:hypothetical protein